MSTLAWIIGAMVSVALGGFAGGAVYLWRKRMEASE